MIPYMIDLLFCKYCRKLSGEAMALDLVPRGDDPDDDMGTRGSGTDLARAWEASSSLRRRAQMHQLVARFFFSQRYPDRFEGR